MNRRVAIKELSVPHGSSQQLREERIKRFKREVKAAGSLAHPNIVTIYEFGTDGDRNFMAMEFLDGHTLRNEIDTHGFLPVSRAIEVAREVLKGLHYAHAHGVVHRDIKPENVQLLEDGRIKITDFGIARLTFEPNLTIDGQVFGTPSYMSPEQVVGKEIDARSDLFSVGVLLYEMISGQKPFVGDSVVSISHAIMNVDPPQPQQANFQLWQVIQRALEKSPPLRYSTASEMIASLDAADDAVRSGATVLDPFPVVQAQGLPYVFGQPLSTPPPVISPNSFPMPQAPHPPANYPYNPYGTGAQPPPSSYSTNQPMPYQFPGGVPIYYPPPPKAPLFKPETKRFMGRLFLTFAIMGSLAALVIVAINTVSNVIAEQRRQQIDETTRALHDQSSPNDPISTRIKRKEDILPKLQSNSERSSIQAELASDYSHQAQMQLQRNDYVGAEYSLRMASRFDPDNPRYYRQLGELFWIRAGAETDNVERQKRFLDCATNYQKSGQLETQEDLKKLANVNAADAYFAAALEFAKYGDATSARTQLYAARALNPYDVGFRKRVQLEIDRLSTPSRTSR